MVLEEYHPRPTHQSPHRRMSAISGFVGEYAFLSPRYFAPIWYEGIEYATLVHAYEAQRTTNRQAQRHIAAADTTIEARKRAAQYSRTNWEDLREQVMWDLLCQKFAPGSALLAQLKATAPQELDNAVDFECKYWGRYKGKGRNRLGELLTLVREGSAPRRRKRA